MNNANILQECKVQDNTRNFNFIKNLFNNSTILSEKQIIDYKMD